MDNTAIFNKKGIIFLALAMALTTVGCNDVYYGAKEVLGFPKRKLLVESLRHARQSQEHALDQFSSAMEKFANVANYGSAWLEEKEYTQLRSTCEKNQSVANSVNSSIDTVRNVAPAMFDEWQEELTHYSSFQLRQASEKKLDQTRDQYRTMLLSMENAAALMYPAIRAFDDQVLFLKHNRSDQAIATLKKELPSVRAQINNLVSQMKTSVSQVDELITNLTSEGQKTDREKPDGNIRYSP